MLLSEFDGFCASLIVCLENVMPREWLSCGAARKSRLHPIAQHKPCRRCLLEEEPGRQRDA